MFWVVLYAIISNAVDNDDRIEWCEQIYVVHARAFTKP